MLTFYVGYNPYCASIANPGVPGLCFACFLIGILTAYREKSTPGIVLGLLNASLVLYAGPVWGVCLLSSAIVFRTDPIRRLMTWVAWYSAAMIAVIGFYFWKGYRSGVLGHWLESIDREYVSDYLADIPLLQSATLFGGYFLLWAGLFGTVTLVASLWSGDRNSRCIAGAHIFYLAIVLCSGFKNLHYLLPLIPWTTVSFMQGVAAAEQKYSLAAGGTYLVTLSLAVLLCWPSDRHTFTANRTLGLQTKMTADSYKDCLRASRLFRALPAESAPDWETDQFTWATYAHVFSRRNRTAAFVVGERMSEFADFQPLVRARRTAKKGIFGRLEGDRSFLQERDHLLPIRRRYPAVMNPLAWGTFAPHGNGVDDVPRIRITNQRRRGPAD